EEGAAVGRGRVAVAAARLDRAAVGLHPLRALVGRVGGAVGRARAVADEAAAAAAATAAAAAAATGGAAAAAATAATAGRLHPARVLAGIAVAGGGAGAVLTVVALV